MKPSEVYGPHKLLLLARIKQLGYRVTGFKIPAPGELCMPHGNLLHYTPAHAAQWVPMFEVYPYRESTNGPGPLLTVAPLRKPKEFLT